MVAHPHCRSALGACLSRCLLSVPPVDRRRRADWWGGLALITICAELFTRAPSKAAAQHQAKRNSLLEASRRNAEVVRAMGMAPGLGERWALSNAAHLSAHRSASDVSGGLGSLSRALRMVLQSLVLGLGAYLVIYQEATAGVIIASSILVSRTLAPVEIAVANWKPFVAARQSWTRLCGLLESVPAERCRPRFPPPITSYALKISRRCRRVRAAWSSIRWPLR